MRLLDAMPRPTTKDLAKAAGVSLATVDRVLNGREGVKQNTVDRVNHAIATLGFVRNLQAANLAKSQTYRFIFALPRSGGQFLEQIIQRIKEAAVVYSADHVWCEVQYIDENDPHSIATYLASLAKKDVAGVAIMSPETPQVRDAIMRLQERGVAVLPFVSNQTKMDADWVGIDNQAAGATAGLLLGQCSGGRTGSIMVISERMQSRDSMERRLGFDKEINENFPNLRGLPSLETYGNEERARSIIAINLRVNPDIIGIYVMASEARMPLSILAALGIDPAIIKIAHERTPFTEQALRDRSLDGVIAQDAGHLVRVAIRRLKGIVDRRQTVESQEEIRIDILLRSNI
ncbi:LacI family DNA-binding transcriptional regulator [Reinekea forsetii]|jgi:LacI family transcriptional regulator|uniref:Transcriptional regulator, LacI family n=1 Tax=Reinekea forsetii TaxID=1336806 RepID=A0A2K8KS67_9GAMM|nr:LacI family DNA-binding transcriptional regulator [Reinekea forsetii]ATX77580.1 transcriptional regulator, LacI family [Reinekea forsetii]